MEKDKLELLIKDICCRIPYGVRFEYNHKFSQILYSFDGKCLNNHYEIDKCRLYLRPMSSITEDELWEFRHFSDHIRDIECKIHIANYKQIDWLNAHHFDYRGLIPMGLALEAPEGMYNT